MEGRSHEEKGQNSHNSEHDPAGLVRNVTADLVEIKPEVDIKWEQEDEVDTIEYTPTLNNSGENFAVKIEKVESDDDDDDDDEVDQAWELFEHFDRFGNFDSLNFSGKPKSVQKTTIETTSKHTDCTSHAANHSTETGNVTTDGQEAGCSHNDSERTARVSEMHTDPAEENMERPSTSKNINKRQSASRSASLSKTKQHKCTECDYVAVSPSQLKAHTRKHTGEKPFPCASCAKKFTRKNDLQRHIKVHVNKDSMHCPGCWQIFTTKEEKLVHESMCKRRRYECFLCHAFSSPYIGNLKSHMRMHSGVRPHECDQCSTKFTRKCNLKRHMKMCSHSPKFRCSVCARNFLKESEKNVHEMNCNRRRYECHLCRNYSTYGRGNLQLHIRMRHTGERPFKCNSCAKCYPMLAELKKHKKTKHKHQLDGEK